MVQPFRLYQKKVKEKICEEQTFATFVKIEGNPLLGTCAVL